MENTKVLVEDLEKRVADIERQIQNLPDKVINEITQGLAEATQNITTEQKKGEEGDIEFRKKVADIKKQIQTLQQKEDDTSTIFTSKELHCIARIIQSSIYAPDNNPFYGCRYCKYGLDCSVENGSRCDLVREKIEYSTGVKLKVLCNGGLERRFLPESFQELYPDEYKKLKFTN